MRDFASWRAGVEWSKPHARVRNVISFSQASNSGVQFHEMKSDLFSGRIIIQSAADCIETYSQFISLLV